MVVLVNEGTRVFTTLYINFSDTQGQIAPESVVVSAKNLISSKLPCMSLLPARMKKIQLKMKALECSHKISPIIGLWGFFRSADLTLQSMVGSGQISNSSETL